MTKLERIALAVALTVAFTAVGMIFIPPPKCGAAAPSPAAERNLSQ